MATGKTTFAKIGRLLKTLGNFCKNWAPFIPTYDHTAKEACGGMIC